MPHRCDWCPSVNAKWRDSHTELIRKGNVVRILESGIWLCEPCYDVYVQGE